MAPMGHGLINFVIYGVIQGMKTHWYMILLAGIPCAIAYYFLFSLLIKKFNLATPGRGTADEVKLSTCSDVDKKYNKTSDHTTALRKQALALIAAHGGRENIENVDACITRLRINVKDRAKVNAKVITEQLDAMGFVESDLQMQSIYGGHANVLKNEILAIFAEGKE